MSGILKEAVTSAIRKHGHQVALKHIRVFKAASSLTFSSSLSPKSTPTSSQFATSASSQSSTSSSSQPSTSTPPTIKDVPGLSKKVVEVPKGEVGPGASKEAVYKNPEYFCYNSGSYFEAEVEMMNYRLPQPSAAQK